MSDTYRRYGAIKQAIMQFYQPRPYRPHAWRTHRHALAALGLSAAEIVGLQVMGAV